MQASIVHWANLEDGQNARLWWQQLCNRQDEFCGTLGWQIPHMKAEPLVPCRLHRRAEADAYDSFDTYYVLVEDKGELVGNARLVRTDRMVKYGKETYSYMVRDAVLGKLDGMPTTISRHVPISAAIWEMSRFQAASPQATRQVFDAAAEFLEAQSATETIAFSRAGFVKMLTRMGWPSEQVGPTISYGPKPYCAIRTFLR